MTATIRDVATAARVSASTVSRVLNERPGVDEELAHRVRVEVERLGYRRNGLARGLRTRATTVLGVVISDVTNPFFTSMLRGIEDRAHRAGYSVVVANADEDLDKEQRYLEVAAAEQMAGVVLSPASSARTDVAVLDRHGIPVVTVDRELRGNGQDSVVIDNHRAAREATTHLVEQGCRRIAFVSGPRATTTGQRRLAGYRGGLRSAGLTPDPSLERRANFRVDGGYEAAMDLLGGARQTRPDGLLVSNNQMALGALLAIQKLGVSMPDELAFASFDSVDWAQALRPTLTMVEQPTYEIGRQAAELLLQRVAGDAAPLQRVVLTAKLAVGESSRRH